MGIGWQCAPREHCHKVSTTKQRKRGTSDTSEVSNQTNHKVLVPGGVEVHLPLGPVYRYASGRGGKARLAKRGKTKINIP